MPRPGLPNPKSLASGDVIAGKFVVERTIGMGGMAQVVSARHNELGTRVAIKVMHAGAETDPDNIARFKREARAMGKLTNEHSVRVYDVGELANGAPFLIMEYLEGKDLGAVLIENGPLRIPDALDWMIQACEALVEAHEVGIVHRDLKPQNLFLSKRGSGESHVRVLDFGLAKPFVGLLITSPKITHDGDVIGTSHYMAPEQVRGADSDARTDVWGAGACLFRLLTGKHAFPGGANPTVTCAMILTEPPVGLRKLRPEIPSGIEQIVLRCLEKDPEKRYESMGDLAHALRAAKNALSGVKKKTSGAHAKAAADISPSTDSGVSEEEGEEFDPTKTVDGQMNTVPLPKLPPDTQPLPLARDIPAATVPLPRLPPPEPVAAVPVTVRTSSSSSRVLATPQPSSAPRQQEARRRSQPPTPGRGGQGSTSSSAIRRSSSTAPTASSSSSSSSSSESSSSSPPRPDAWPSNRVIGLLLLIVTWVAVIGVVLIVILVRRDKGSRDDAPPEMPSLSPVPVVQPQPTTPSTIVVAPSVSASVVSAPVIEPSVGVVPAPAPPPRKRPAPSPTAKGAVF